MEGRMRKKRKIVGKGWIFIAYHKFQLYFYALIALINFMLIIKNLACQCHTLYSLCIPIKSLAFNSIEQKSHTQDEQREEFLLFFFFYPSLNDLSCSRQELREGKIIARQPTEERRRKRRNERKGKNFSLPFETMIRRRRRRR